MRAQLDRVLHDSLPTRLILELAPGTHLSAVLDLLRSSTWRDRIAVRQVLLALDGAVSPWSPSTETTETAETAETVKATRVSDSSVAFARQWQSQLLACTHVLMFDPPMDPALLEQGLIDRPFAAELARVNGSHSWPGAVAQSDELAPSSTWTPWCEFKSVLTDQIATSDSSWSLRTTEGNRVVLDAAWPADRPVDRRRVIELFKAFTAVVPVHSGQACFATARDWYEWRCAAGRDEWRETEYRAGVRLRMECDDRENVRAHIECLRIAIESATLR